MSKKKVDVEGSFYGEPRPETEREISDGNRRVVITLKEPPLQFVEPWFLKDRPTINNLKGDRCEECGEKKEYGCEHWCASCEQSMEDCTFCGDCDSHECTCGNF